MTREADQAAEVMGTAQAAAAAREGSSTEPSAIQIKMPNSDPDPRPRIRARHQDKTLGGVEQLLQDLMTRLDKNDRRYGEALGGPNALSQRAQAISSEQVGDTRAALDRLRKQASLFAEQVDAAGAAHSAQQSTPQIADNGVGHSSGANDDLPRPDFGDTRLNKNFAAVTEKLDRSLSACEPAKDFDALSQQMDALARRFDTALDTRNDITALQKIESQLNVLTSGFAEAQQTYAKVDAIESFLINLMRWAESTGAPSQNANDDGRLATIEQALIDLSDSAREMDSRTVGTLQAMNEVLHSLTSQEGTRAAAKVEVSSDVSSKTGAPAPRMQAEEVCRKQGADAHIEQPASVENTQNLRPDVSANPLNTLEGTVPDSLPPSSKSETAAPTQSVERGTVRQLDPQPQTDATYKADSDFIASARHAAQQPALAGSRRSARSKSNFPGADAGKISSATAQSDKRRPALIAAAVLLLIISAGLLYSRLKSVPEVQPAVVAPQNTASSALPYAYGGSNNETTKTKSATSGAKTIAWPKSSQISPPNQERHPDRIGGTRAANPRTNIVQRPHLAASKQGSRTVTRRSAAALAPGQTISTATLLASLPPAARKPQPPDVTMEIEEPLRRTTTTRTSDAAGAAAPALVPSTTTRPQGQLLPQPKRAPTQQGSRDDNPANLNPVDSAPANEIAGTLDGSREIIPPARIGPQSLRVAAARGNPAAQVEVGSRYAKGTGVSKDLKKAAEWYGRAAAQGHAPAQYRLAVMHERGEGVKKESGIARTWYRRAAELGNIRAMHNLAVLYTRREANGPDYTSAKKWFYQAAHHGLADSQFNLGILYEGGLGARKNSAEAYKWFSLAARQGDTEARKRRETIRPQLPAKSLRAAEKAIASWRKTPANAEANHTGPWRGGWPNANARQTTGSAKPALIARAQKLLNELGYDAGIADGRLGPQTKSAIRKFEDRSGIKGTVTVTPALLRRLEALAT